jgi:hypothetical protein
LSHKDFIFRLLDWTRQQYISPAIHVSSAAIPPEVATPSVDFLQIL